MRGHWRATGRWMHLIHYAHKCVSVPCVCGAATGATKSTKACRQRLTATLPARCRVHRAARRSVAFCLRYKNGKYSTGL